MRELAEQLQRVEHEIAEERGPFTLFGLFLRDGAPDRWDVVFAAPWVDEDEYAAIRFMADRLRKALKKTDLVSISRVVPILKDNPGLKAVTRAIDVSHGMVEVENTTFFDLAIRHAFIITAGKRPASKGNGNGRK